MCKRNNDNDLIRRGDATAHPFANGQYDHDNKVDERAPRGGSGISNKKKMTMTELIDSIYAEIDAEYEASAREWIIVSKERDYRTIRCPNCNDMFNIDYIRWFYYCPTCGERMRRRTEKIDG